MKKVSSFLGSLVLAFVAIALTTKSASLKVQNKSAQDCAIENALNCGTGGI